MKRKVVAHGTNTLTVSLPADWAKRNNVTVGDELEVTDKLTKLEICKEKDEEKKEITLEVKEINSYLFKRLLGNFYRRGYDKVTLCFTDDNLKQEARMLINDFITQCIGWEILSEEGNKIVIKTFASPDTDNFNNVLRRYFLLSLQITEELCKKQINSEVLDTIISLERKQNSLYLYCTRLLNKTKHIPKEELILYYLLIERLEEIGDEYRDLALFLTKNKMALLSKEINELARQTNTFLRFIYDLYYDPNEKKVLEVTKKREEINKMRMEIFDKIKQEEIYLMHFLSSAFVKIYEASSPIVGLYIVKE